MCKTGVAATTAQLLTEDILTSGLSETGAEVSVETYSPPDIQDLDIYRSMPTY